MSHHIDWHVLERWLAGECTWAEDAAVRVWLDADPWNRTYLETLRHTLGLDHPTPEDWDLDRAWSRMADATGAAPPPLAPPIHLVAEKRGRRWRPAASLRWLVPAAAVALVAGGALMLERAAGRRPDIASPPSPRQFATARGQRLSLRLADGTRVTLGPLSRLEVPAAYGTADRLVRLDGEGYFDVVHDSAHPFAVRAGHALARDIGTRFTVRSRSGEPDVRVVVTEGKVALGDTVLARGDLGRVDTAGVSRVVRGVDVERYLAWTDGRLVFDRTPLAAAAAELSRWYDIDVVLAVPGLESREVTVAFQSESLDQVLDAVAFIAHARYERSATRVTFYPAR